MKINEILNHKDLKLSETIVAELNENITGRVAINKMIGATHILYLVKELLKDDCKTVLEIGTLWGGALLTMMRSEYTSKFVSMDMFEGFYPNLLGEGSHDGYGINTEELVTKNILNNNPFEHEFELIKGSSHDEKIVKYVKKNYSEIDLFFIDGDHTKKGVLQDWKDYSSLVTKGGIVIFDDYWIGEYERAAWKKEDENGVKWMDVVGAVDEIAGSDNFTNEWNYVGLFGDKYILERK